MKKMAIALAAALMMGTAAMAQQQEQGRPDGRRPDRTEMVKHRTDQMVKQYGLNDSQAKQLLELNTKYADRIGGPRGPRPGFGDGQRPQRRDSVQRGPRPQRPDSLQRGQQRGQRPDPQAMKAYEDELQKIMTADQYKAYKADMEKRRQQGPRGGQRPPQNQ